MKKEKRKGEKKENKIQRKREKETQKGRNNERKRRICSLNFLFDDCCASVLCNHCFFSKPNDVTKAIYPRDDSPFQNIER